MLPVVRNHIFERRPEAAQEELKRRTVLARTSAKRKLVNALQSRNALREIRELPGPEESLHIIARGNFPLWQVVPAVLALASPATITDLHIATLGFSQSNAEALLAMLDAGKVQSVHVVASVYFERQNPAEWRAMADGLRDRGQKIAAVRAHAKIIAIRLSDGRGITVESSANLRSCRNIEQLTIANSEPLRAFHAGWIQEVIAHA